MYDWAYLEQWSAQNEIQLRYIDSFWRDSELGHALCDAHHAQRFASVSDILRVLILRSEGGLYVDTDVLPVSLEAQSVPTGIGLIIRFDAEGVRSVLPHAILMAPRHPFADLMVAQLEYNVRFFRQHNLSWMFKSQREYQYAATVGVTGTIGTLLMLRLRETDLPKPQLEKLQLPYALIHEEHNSWLYGGERPRKQWRPIEYLTAQQDWAVRQPKAMPISELENHYMQCTIGA